MAASANPALVFSATYSNVPVFEFNVDNSHVMRRRADDWINATHILKVAGFDKPARTRILEREVQKGVHEKVQGGYGKYQGTWIPLREGRHLAERNGVLDKLRPIFDYVPGDRSPPQAPKHTTAASTKPKVPRATAARRAPKPKLGPARSQISEDLYDDISAQLNDDETPDRSYVSVTDEEDLMHNGQYTGSRKRKRGAGYADEWTRQDHEDSLYADSLLDYFMLKDGDAPYLGLNPPVPPENFQIDRNIDNQNHTALHWAAAMGEVDIVKDLIRRGASIDSRNIRGETPLIRAAIFANCFDKGEFPRMAHLLQDTITTKDSHGSTIFHHVAMTTVNSVSKAKRARHYLDVLLNKLKEITTPQEFTSFLCTRDRYGDTAFHIVAQHSKRCTKTFQSHGLPSDIPNVNHKTVDDILHDRVHTPRPNNHYQNFDPLSSSPVPMATPNGHHPNVLTTKSTNAPSRLSLPHYQTHSARSFSESFSATLTDKATLFTQTMESEIHDRDLDLAEAERLLANAARERHSIRQRTLALMATAEASASELPALRAHIASLRAHAEAKEETHQQSVLHALVRAEEGKVRADNSKLKSSAAADNNATDGDDENDSVVLQTKLRLACALHAEQVLRRDLTRRVVLARAQAGMSEKGEVYARLTAEAMGVSVAELHDVLPEVLEELEMGRMEEGVDGKV
ncbi:hypothetical protein MMC20_005714 [Loxospora ochrophaea]|nr:hypothetical protein [Loxospora ochrophaea]